MGDCRGCALGMQQQRWQKQEHANAEAEQIKSQRLRRRLYWICSASHPQHLEQPFCELRNIQGLLLLEGSPSRSTMM